MAEKHTLSSTQTPVKPASERFMDVIAGILFRELPPRDSRKSKELSQVFMNDLLNLPGPRAIGHVERAESKFLRALIHGYFEIQAAYFTISSVPVYFRRSPRGLKRAARADYLAFVVHGYLEEIYIIEQRMATYLKTLLRAASKGSEVRRRLEEREPYLSKLAGEAFESVRGARGAHVHHQRFHDDGIARLSRCELLSPHFPPLEPFYRSELHRVRKYWGERFAANEIAMNAFLEQYYDLILSAVLSEDGELRSFL
jgi:hypothetical protein